jgi:peptidoglycan-associated lipoprotein
MSKKVLVSLFSSRALVAPAAVLCALSLGAFGCATTDKDAGTGETGSEWKSSEPAAAAPSTGKGTKLESVYFDFDRSEIRDDARATLQTNAQSIGSASGTVTIEGHCDERGSEEYNLALGERRANSVRKYLVNLGVADSRLRTISYGEAKPAVQGHDESAWRWNRRAAFLVGG